MTDAKNEGAGGASASNAGLATVCDEAIREFSKHIGRPLRTSEFIIYKTAWNVALEVAATKIEEPWGHITSDSEICRDLICDHG